jgi:hypothetical protein
MLSKLMKPLKPYSKTLEEAIFGTDKMNQAIG